MTSILHGQGAITLRHIPVDRNGRPRVVASATFEIVDLRYSEDSADRPVDSGAATVGTVNTTLTAAAGPGQTDTDLLAVASATGISVGRPFLLAAADGVAEVVSVRVVSASNVYTHFELRHDYAIGASLRSLELTAAFPAAEANDDTEIEAEPHPYQVTWTYTIDDEVYVVPQVLWLSRVSLAPVLTELDVLGAYPTIGARLRNRADLTDAIKVAHDDYLAEVVASGRNPAEFRGNSTVPVVLRARALEYAFRWCGPAPHDVAESEKFGSQFRYLIGQLLHGRPRPNTVTVSQPTNTGTQDTVSTHPFLRRR